jgi:hypothetical protein
VHGNSAVARWVCAMQSILEMLAKQRGAVAAWVCTAPSFQEVLAHCRLRHKSCSTWLSVVWSVFQTLQGLRDRHLWKCTWSIIHIAARLSSFESNAETQRKNQKHTVRTSKTVDAAQALRGARQGTDVLRRVLEAWRRRRCALQPRQTAIKMPRPNVRRRRLSLCASHSAITLQRPQLWWRRCVLHARHSKISVQRPVV